MTLSSATENLAFFPSLFFISTSFIGVFLKFLLLVEIFDAESSGFTSSAPILSSDSASPKLFDLYSTLSSISFRVRDLDFGSFTELDLEAEETEDLLSELLEDFDFVDLFEDFLDLRSSFLEGFFD
jgi:hypothetical protein